MTLSQILILAIIQGAAELLPVSSSAHVIVAEKLMGLDPTAPEMTLLLVMLHTGTMFAVIGYFWRSWRESFFSSREALADVFRLVVVATLMTGIIGLGLKTLIEHVFMKGMQHAEIEDLFGNTTLISAALFAVGILILIAGFSRREQGRTGKPMTTFDAAVIGAVQGICLPFRGFSRSGATISTGLLLNVSRARTEEFSFALAVVLTPPVIARETWRLLRDQHVPLTGPAMLHVFMPGLLAMCMSFVAGLLALRWLSTWLENGRWQLFGIYCLLASLVVYVLNEAVF